MKQFSCGDVVPGCNAKFQANNEDSILALVADHATHDHGLTEIPDSLVQQVRQHISLVS